jgi:hypothetical protein
MKYKWVFFMKILLILTLFFPISVFAFTYNKPFLTDERLGYCYYDDGSVIRKEGVNCPLRLGRFSSSSKSESRLGSEEFQRRVLERQQKNIDMMQQGLSDFKSGIVNKAREKKIQRKMSEVLRDYPNAYSILREPDLINLFAKDDATMKVYMQARDTNNPNPFALEAVIVAYEIYKMRKHDSYKRWQLTLNNRQKQELQNAFDEGNKGDFSKMKLWILKWKNFKNSN